MSWLRKDWCSATKDATGVSTTGSTRGNAQRRFACWARLDVREFLPRIRQAERIAALPEAIQPVPRWINACQL